MSCRISAAALPGYRPCAGIFLLDSADRVFVGLRSDARDDKAWQMPQGGIDGGENVVVAARREMREEIGTDNAELLMESAWWRSYDLPPEIAGRMWRGRYRGQTQKWVAFRFKGDDSEIRIDGPQPEFKAWRWLDPERLADHIVAFKRDAYLSVVEEFRCLWA